MPTGLHARGTRTYLYGEDGDHANFPLSLAVHGTWRARIN